MVVIHKRTHRHLDSSDEDRWGQLIRESAACLVINHYRLVTNKRAAMKQSSYFG